MKTDQLRGQTLAASLSGRFWNQGEAEVWTIRRRSLSVKLVSDGDAPVETWRFDIHCLSNSNGKGKTAFVQMKSEVLPRPDVLVDVLNTKEMFFFYCEFI